MRLLMIFGFSSIKNNLNQRRLIALIAKQRLKMANNDNTKFLHSECTFNNCSRNSNGGSIYFNCKGNIVQHRFCSTNSQVTSGRSHYSETNVNTETNFQVISESAVSSCGNSKYERTIYIIRGSANITLSNITKNTAKSETAYSLYQDLKSFVSFCNIESNQCSSGYWCLAHHRGLPDEHNVQSCSIINNSVTSTDYGIILTPIKTTISNSTIFKNFGSSILFDLYSTDQPILIENCLIQSSPSIDPKITTKNVEFINELNIVNFPNKCDYLVKDFTYVVYEYYHIPSILIAFFVFITS